MKRRIWPVALGFGYIAVNALLGGLTKDQIVIGCLGLLDALHEKSRLFLKLFFPFILTGIVYDSMRYYYWSGVKDHIHVAEPYFRDLNWFGIWISNRGSFHRVTPNEYFLLHRCVALDLACGFAYLIFVAEYLVTAIYLFYKKYFNLLQKMGWCFFIVNLMGFVTYFIYPAFKIPS